MPLPAGTRFGPYDVLALIGAGGMGEVYRARDIKLKRNVALKVLPEAFASDPDRMARFQREAEVLASLNHPNIASIYGVEERALVMELVDGESPKGPMPFEEAWKIAVQIAAALEYAHERGIVHRDLKPANIKVSTDGVVKLLDFGLAKAFTVQTADTGSPENSPTLTLGMTRLGVILGTAAYMAPEQAKAKTIDKRADIWSFGVVFYELLSGKRLFKGEDVSDTLALILTKEPDLEQAPPQTRELLRRCLEKDPKNRLRDIGDAKLLLQDAPVKASSRSTLLAWLVAAACVVTAAIGVWSPWRSRPASPEALRLELLPPANISTSVAHALSPDGRQLAFPAIGSDGITRLWIRDLNSGEARVLPGVQLHADPPPAFWSPDSRSIAFDGVDGLQRVDLAGGPPQNLWKGFAIGGSWNRDDVIIFGSVTNGIVRLPAAGGSATSVTQIDPGHGVVQHVYPSFLPDGQHFLYLQSFSNPEENGIYLASLNDLPAKQHPKKLLASAVNAIFVPAAGALPDQLLFGRNGKLMAQSFDPRREELTGEPVEVADQVGAYLTFGFFSASANGRLVYRANGPDFQLTWFDAKGEILGKAAEPGLYGNLALSPDDARAVAARGNVVDRDLWVIDFARNTTTRLTFTPFPDDYPVWSPDGKRIIFASAQSKPTGTSLVQRELSGAAEEKLSNAPVDALPTSWSRDGRWLLFTMAGQTTKSDVWVMPLDGSEKPRRLLGTEFDESEARFSPDARWISYTSNESGRKEVYVQTFPNGENREVVSTAGGSGAHWRVDGKQLYYLASDGNVTAIDVGYGRTLALGAPRSLFQTPRGTAGWDVAADGKRFLLAAPAQQGAPTPFTVLLNWQAALKH